MTPSGPSAARTGPQNAAGAAAAAARAGTGRAELPSLTLVGGVVFSVALVGFMRVPLLPDIARDLQLTTGAVSMITAAFAVGRLIMDLPAGRIADRLPPLLALAVTGVGITLAAALLAAAGSLGVALAGAALLGLVSAQTNTTAMKAFATRGGGGSRARSMAVYSSALMTGQMLGPAVGGLLAGLVGWRAAQGAGAAVGVVVAVACWVVARRLAGRAASRGSATGDAARLAGAPARGNGASGPPPQADRPAYGMSRRDAAVLAGVPFAVFFSMGGVLQTLVPLIGAGSLGLGPAVIGLVAGLGGLLRVAGASVAGRLADTVSRKAGLVPGLVLMAAGGAMLIPDPTLGTWIAAVAVMSFASSGMPVAATMIADRVPAGTLGRHLGSYRFVGDAGLLAGPALGGLLAEHAGRGAAMGLAAAILLASAASLRLVADVPPEQRS